MYRVDVYLRVRRAVMVEGKSIREVSREFGLHRDTVRKMLAYSVPPGYRRQSPPKRPKLEPFTGVIDRILEDDLRRLRKQRHTAKRIFERLRDEYGFDGGYTTVKDYVREHRRQTKEMFVPLSHPPGHAQCDFGEAVAVIGGVERKVHYFVLDLPHSDGCLVKAYPAETTEAFLDGHVSAFAFLGGCPRASCTTIRSWRWLGYWAIHIQPLDPGAEDEGDQAAITDSAVPAGKPKAASPRKPTFLERERWKTIQKARRKGMSLRAIERELGIHRATVRKYLDADGPPTRRPWAGTTPSSSDTMTA